VGIYHTVHYRDHLCNVKIPGFRRQEEKINTLSAQDLNIAAIRTDYTLAALSEAGTGNDPIHFFDKWFKEAGTAQVTEVNAMTLATVDSLHRPHARIVLLKGVDDKGFVFFTNYNSAKGRDIAANANAALLFFWKELERQVRIEGILEKVSEEDSDQYFNSRPIGSRIGAWASPQSTVIADRTILEENYVLYEQKYGHSIVPRPPFWGGYRLVANSIEFWQGRSNRMHDRILFTKDNSGWAQHRLAP